MKNDLRSVAGWASGEIGKRTGTKPSEQIGLAWDIIKKVEPYYEEKFNKINEEKIKELEKENEQLKKILSEIENVVKNHKE